MMNCTALSILIKKPQMWKNFTVNIMLAADNIST